MLKNLRAALSGFFVAVLLIAMFPVGAQENDSDVPGKCGTERWPVKTLTDAAASQIDFSHPVDTTVAALRALPVSSNWNKNSTTRYHDAETTLWRVTAVLVGWKLEADKDFHIVIRDPKDPKATMIVEPPDPTCSTAPQGVSWGKVRAAFVQCFGMPTPRFQKFPPNMTAVLTGPGFFDALHGQTGVAPNGIELHPLSSVKTLPGVTCPHK